MSSKYLNILQITINTIVQTITSTQNNKSRVAGVIYRQQNILQ